MEIIGIYQKKTMQLPHTHTHHAKYRWSQINVNVLQTWMGKSNPRWEIAKKHVSMGHKTNLVNHIDMRWSFEVRVRHGKTLGFELLYLVNIYLILSINNHCLSLDICSYNQLYMLVIWLRMLQTWNLKKTKNHLHHLTSTNSGMLTLPFQQRPFRRDAVRARAAALACTEPPCIEREGRGSEPEMRLDLPAKGGWRRQLVQPKVPLWI